MYFKVGNVISSITDKRLLKNGAKIVFFLLYHTYFIG